MRLDLIFLALILNACPSHAADAELILSADIATAQDGRATIHQLYSSYARLLEEGWQLDVITHSQPAGTEHPIDCRAAFAA